MSQRTAVSLLRQCTAGISSPVASAARRRSAHQSLSRAHAARLLALRSGLIRPYSTQQQENNGTEGIKKEEQTKANENAESAKREEGESNNGGNGSTSQSASQNQSQSQNGEDALSDCLKKLKAKEDEVTDLTSRLRYLQADFLNLQRNAAREKEQTKDFAITRFAGDLLETVDVLSLALKSVPESALKPPSDDVSAAASQSASSTSESESGFPATSSTTSSATSTFSNSSTSTAQTKSAIERLRELHHGVEMTHRLLLQTLFKYGVKPFDPTGDTFDPNRHEALYQAPIPGKKPGVVIDCQKTGFTIKDRTLRAAQVGVASEPPSSS